MNTPRQSEVEERHLDLMLDERLGGQRGPDVSAQVERELANTAHAKRAGLPRIWLQAACVLLGLMVVAGMHLLTSAAPPSLLQEPALGPVVTVASIAAIEALPVDTDNVKLTLHTKDAVRALTRLRRLRRLDASFDLEPTFRPRSIVRPKFFPDAARFLGMLTSLEQLDLSGHSPITGLEQLATLSRLRSLRIFYAYMDPAGLTVLGQLPKLEDLELEATLRSREEDPLIDLRNPDYGFVSFLQKGQLRRLKLTACITDAAGIAAIAQNPLEQLNLYGLSQGQRTGQHRNALQAEAYEAVGRITTLRDLTLGDVVNKKLRDAFASMRQLEVLNIGGAAGLEGTEVGQAIAKIPNLRTLRLEGSDIDTEALLAATESKGVVELELGGYQNVTNHVLAAVARMPKLRDLTMTLKHSVTDAGMQVLSDTQLETFTIRWSEKVTDNGVALLPRTVRRLTVYNKALGPRTLARLDQLTELTVWFYPDTERELFEDILAAPLHKTLRKLRVEGTIGLLGDLGALAKMPALRELDLRHSAGEVPADQLALLRARGVSVQLPPPKQERESTVIDEVWELAPKAKQGGKIQGGR